MLYKMGDFKDLQEIEALIAQLIEEQTSLLAKIARRIVPRATAEDILQPNDFPQLESHPHFRYEEGVLAGMLAMQMALRAHSKKS